MTHEKLASVGARAVLVAALAAALSACASGRRCGSPCPPPCPPPCASPCAAPVSAPQGQVLMVPTVKPQIVVVDGTGVAAPGTGFVTMSVESREPTDPLERLMAGNARFVAERPLHADARTGRRAQLATSQAPFAIVLGCADSRVGPELVFDQGLGDLFVVRVAGNVVDPSILGSIEYAAEHLHSTLLVVLGHERCGAVSAALDGGEAPGNIKSLVDAIQPAVASSAAEPGDKLDNAVRANVRLQEQNVRARSAILDHLIADGKLRVVGARYDLDTGEVEILK